MKQKAMIMFFFLCIVCSASAQEVFEEIVRNSHLSANNYCVYPDLDNHQYVEAPEGKKPFYISHYGRHGSRYLSQMHAYDVPFEILNKADSLGKLTPLGTEVYRKVAIIRRNAIGRNGDLTDLGSTQHRHIARRMIEHFPEVFEGRAVVDARSTTRHRCILSMGAAVQQMASMKPDLRLKMDASQHDMWYLNYQDKLLRDSMMTYRAMQAYLEFTQKREHNERLMGLLFNDTAYVNREVDSGTLNYYLFKVASIQQDTQVQDSSHLINIFTNEELYHIWQKENAWWYICYGPSLLNGGKEPYTQRHLLRKMIEEADSCISLSQPGATLRYGHETVLLSLVCLLGMNGYDFKTMDLEEVEKNGWVAYRIFPMGCNVQMIFYRKDPFDKDVLVKVLLNEEEAVLPVKTNTAPYYRWSDFKDFYLAKLNAYSE